MANRKQSMIMRDERYVDRRLKIFKVKKKGPIFDVKKIAADLKAKTAKAVESLKERQTNSDLINSIQIKSMMIPPQPPVKRPIESRPTECYTIIDSSEDEDDDLSITCNIHVKALLAPNNHHSFYVPVDIPCRNDTYRSDPLPALAQAIPKTSYSATNIPQSFNCSVNLERLPSSTVHANTSDVAMEEAMDSEDDTQTENWSTDQNTDTLNVKSEFTGAETQRAAKEPNVEAHRKDMSTVIPHSLLSADFRIRHASTESSFDISVQDMPTIETPPPEMHQPPAHESQRFNELHNTIRALEARLKRETKDVRTLPALLPLVKKDHQVIACLPSPVEEPPAATPTPPPPPPARPVIKLRNINELLDPRKSGNSDHLLLTNRILNSFAPNYQQAPINQTAPNNVPAVQSQASVLRTTAPAPILMAPAPPPYPSPVNPLPYIKAIPVRQNVPNNVAAVRKEAPIPRPSPAAPPNVAPVPPPPYHQQPTNHHQNIAGQYQQQVQMPSYQPIQQLQQQTNSLGYNQTHAVHYQGRYNATPLDYPMAQNSYGYSHNNTNQYYAANPASNMNVTYQNQYQMPTVSRQ